MLPHDDCESESVTPEELQKCLRFFGSKDDKKDDEKEVSWPEGKPIRQLVMHHLDTVGYGFSLVSSRYKSAVRQLERQGILVITVPCMSAAAAAGMQCLDALKLEEEV